MHQQQGPIQGAIQGLANEVLTVTSVRAQWRVIIGVRACLAWSCGIICCHRKCLDTGVSARSQFRVASVSCLFAFLNRVLKSFGWFSRSIRSGDVSFYFLSWKSAWVVFVCANFLRMQFSVKISAHFVIPPSWGIDSVLSVVSSV